MATTKASIAAGLAAAKSPVLLIGPQVPATQPIRDLRNEVIGKLKLAWAMAGAGVKPAQPAAADKLFRDWFARQPPAVRKAAQARAKALVAADPVLRRATFGRWGAIDAKAYRGADTPGALGRLALDPARLETALRSYGTADVAHTELQATAYARGRLTTIDVDKLRKVANPDQIDGAKYKRLRLYLNSVHCIDEVGFGSSTNHMVMGGLAIDPAGGVQVIPAVSISDQFDDGEVVIYGGAGKVLHDWSIVRAAGWPHAYGTLIVLIERDSTEPEFPSFLAGLCEVIQDSLRDVLADAVGPEAAQRINALFADGWGGGTFLAITEAIFSWFVHEDDYVGAKGFVMNLGAGTKSYYDWAGLTLSPLGQFAVDFIGFGGRYRTWMSMGVVP